MVAVKLNVHGLVKRMATMLVVYFVVVLIGAGIIQALEEDEQQWSYADSFYFMTMASTTIGFGDFVPVTKSGRMFVTFYSVFAVAVFFLGLAYVGCYHPDHDDDTDTRSSPK